jgi:hypothetical protein
LFVFLALSALLLAACGDDEGDGGETGGGATQGGGESDITVGVSWNN